MKKQIFLNLKSIVNRLFFKLGYYPPKKIVRPQKIINQFKKQPTPVIHYRLKNISAQLQELDDHEYYNKMLQKLISTWNIKIEKAKFIGNGHGLNNLNSYRKVKVNGKYYFEKIYFTNSTDLKKVQWFLNEIFANNNFKFKSPQIKRIYEGEFLSIVYFEFCNLIDLSKNEIESALTQVSNKL